MACNYCRTEQQTELPAEVSIHFRGLNNLSKPPVWVYPTVSVCLHCGHAEFAIPENELRQLTQSVPPAPRNT